MYRIDGYYIIFNIDCSLYTKDVSLHRTNIIYLVPCAGYFEKIHIVCIVTTSDISVLPTELCIIMKLDI